MSYPNTDERTVAHLEAQVEFRLAPDRQRADLLALGSRLDALAAHGAKTFAVIARALGGWPAAVAFLDGLDTVRRFVARFHAEGVPSLWPAATVVRLDVFGVDLAYVETAWRVADQPRGRWLLAADTDELIDPQTRPVAHASGAGRAARRRKERGA
jgi:hypothetical protein